MAMGQFSLDLSKFAEKAGINFDRMVKKVVFDIYTRVAMRTPVDTGRARGGWQIGGTLGSGQSGAIDKTPTGTLNPGWGELGKINNLITKAKVIGYIYNNVVYIGVLEYGRASGEPGSKQAPRGMVRITQAEFAQFINKAIAELR